MKGFVTMTQSNCNAKENTIHTLGPTTSDSFVAYKYACDKYAEIAHAKLFLHSSYSDIYNHLKEMSGDLILVPVAYKGKEASDNWTDNNFKYSEILSIVDSFVLPTKKMVLLENLDAQYDKAIIHPATTIYIKTHAEKLGRNIKIDFADSKPLAFSIFIKENYRYTIASYDVYLNNKYEKVKICETFSPQMIWCVYKIR